MSPGCGRDSRDPRSTSEPHVVVATIQTLHAKLSNQSGEYGFLADFRLVVFDEAHRSIAPTFTSVMEEIGLTRFQRADEPFMLGLTATPYRGHDEEETYRLVHRYGSNRLDSGAFASDEPEVVIQELQGMGVLAQADHETIEGETFSLDAILGEALDKENLKRKLDKWSKLPWLPQSVENRIARSAGSSLGRWTGEAMRHLSGPPLSVSMCLAVPRGSGGCHGRKQASGHGKAGQRRAEQVASHLCLNEVMMVGLAIEVSASGWKPRPASGSRRSKGSARKRRNRPRGRRRRTVAGKRCRTRGWHARTGESA